MPKFQHQIIIVFVFLIASGCKKEAAVVDCEVSENQLAASNDTVQGKVYFYNNSSGVPNATVSIVGSTLQTVTDQNGFYRFTNLGADTIDIAVLTPLGRRNQLQRIAHAAGATTLLDIATYDNNFYATVNISTSIHTFTNNSKALLVSFDKAFDGGGPYVMTVLSDSTGADPALVKTFDYSFDPYLGPNNAVYITISDKVYYPSGTKVYVDVYLHHGRYSTYTDVYTNRLVYVGGGKSRTPNAFVIWP